MSSRVTWLALLLLDVLAIAWLYGNPTGTPLWHLSMSVAGAAAVYAVFELGKR